MSAVSVLLREMRHREIRVRAGHMEMEIPEGAYEIRTSLGGPAGMWWVLEHKIGEEPFEKKVKGELVETIVPVYGPDWKEAAGTMLDSINGLHWVIEAAILGEYKAPRHEWLCCDACDESQMLPKAYGAASQKHKCHMTPNCTGIVRRFPSVFDVTPPKLKRPAKPTPEITPGAERFKAQHADTSSDE